MLLLIDSKDMEGALKEVTKAALVNKWTLLLSWHAPVDGTDRRRHLIHMVPGGVCWALTACCVLCAIARSDASRGHRHQCGDVHSFLQ